MATFPPNDEQHSRSSVEVLLPKSSLSKKLVQKSGNFFYCRWFETILPIVHFIDCAWAGQIIKARLGLHPRVLSGTIMAVVQCAQLPSLTAKESSP